jgi:HSP20 family molecular chaperone IbpA
VVGGSVGDVADGRRHPGVAARVDVAVWARLQHLEGAGTKSIGKPRFSLGKSATPTRAFERRFSLADHVKIIGATLADGVL